MAVSCRLALGCNAFGHIAPEQSAALVRAALDRGVTFFDTADVYAGGASEAELGRLLPRDRSDITVATKFGHPASAGVGSAPCRWDAVLCAAEASLRRLRCERIDLYLIHFPDPLTPFDETLGALESLIIAGKVARYGVSNFTPVQLQALIATADQIGMARPQIVQEEYSLLRHAAADDLSPTLAEFGIGLVPFFPLASGLLTGKYRDSSEAAALRTRIVRKFNERFLNPANLARVAAFQAICDEHGASLVALALQWLTTRPMVEVIAAGASSAAQLHANLDAMNTPLPPGLLAAATAIVDQP